MPFDATAWKSLIIKGTFPTARFFSFATYVAQGSVVDSINDVAIDPRVGSTNPFRPGPDAELHKYTITISRDPAEPGETNHVMLGDTPLAWIIYRIYLPDQGLNRKAGVALPRVILVAQDGSRHPVPQCPFTKPSVQLSFMLAELRAAGFGTDADSTQTKFSEGDPGGLPTDETCQPQDQVVFWIPKNTGGLFPNPANKYIAAPGLCFDSGKVVVVRGRAAVFPDTYDGGAIWEPAMPGKIRMRYWSLCNNDQITPFPVVSCQPDATTNLDLDGYYTYVLGEGDTAPTSLPSKATWVPWGLKDQPNILILRNMLPKRTFDNSIQTAIAAGCVVDNQSGVTPPRDEVVAAGECAQQVMQEYYPRAVFCDKQRLLDQGWNACFAAAGVPAR